MLCSTAPAARKHIQQPTNSPAQIVIPSPDEVNLTDYATGLGCACKIKAELLETFLGDVQLNESDENVLVGTETGDDASVVKVSDDVAVVNTTDFFPPIVDDATTFGSIATANAISDVYAMGGKPLSALSLVGFPTTTLPVELLTRIMTGAKKKAKEAGIILSGGHSIDLSEPIFGLAVTGTVHPQQFLRNVGVCEGDYLILTKPLGTGILTSALKRNDAMVSEATKKAGLGWMQVLNRCACEAVMDAHNRPTVHAMTDVTGFGFLGHLMKMIRGEEKDGKPITKPADQLVANIFASAVPLIPGIDALLAQRDMTIYSTSSFNNMSFVSAHTLFRSTIPYPLRLILADAQTSGGLIISVASKAAAEKLVGDIKTRLVAALKANSESAPGLSEKDMEEAVKIVGCVSKGATHPLLTPERRANPPYIIVSSAEGDALTGPATLERMGVVKKDGLQFVEKIALDQPTTTTTTTATSTSSSSSSSTAAPAEPPLHVPDPKLVWFYKNSVTTMADEKLGKVLIAGMLSKALTSSHGSIPGTIILMGDGIEIGTTRDDTVKILQTYERLGTRILICTTCLTMLKLLDKVRVGKSATAQEIADVLSDPSVQIVTMA